MHLAEPGPHMPTAPTTALPSVSPTPHTQGSKAAERVTQRKQSYIQMRSSVAAICPEGQGGHENSQWGWGVRDERCVVVWGAQTRASGPALEAAVRTCCLSCSRRGLPGAQASFSGMAAQGRLSGSNLSAPTFHLLSPPGGSLEGFCRPLLGD